MTLLSAAYVGLAGCQSNPMNWGDEVRGSIDADLNQSRARDTNAGVPSDVSKALLPPLEIAVPDGKAMPLESRFDLSVSGASARQVFMGLVEGTPYDVIVQPSVSGSVTVNLKDVTVPEAFSALREAYGYEYRREGNRFVVLGREMQTKLFSVNYLNLVRRGKSDTRVSGGGIGTRASSSGGATAAAGEQSGFSSVELETQSQSDFWKDLQGTLSALLGDGGGRKVIVNAQTGVVAVRALPNELRLIEEYLGSTHAAVNRQVVLEAKIIEVELNDRFQTGINWAKVSGDYTAGQVGGGSSNLPTTGSTPVGNLSGSLLPGSAGAGALPGLATLTDAFGGVFTLTALGSDFTAMLELLKAQGEVQVLSTPRVSAINNQKAVIKVGADEFFVTGISSTTSSTGGDTSPTVELASFFSGIVLDVTPQIDENNNVVLHIHPSVSAVSEKVKVLEIANESFSLPLAFSTIQESDNVVRAASGQVIIIGGLMKEGSTDDNASVPFLGDIPILGNLFKHKRITRIKKELVILLKPTVIHLDKDWDNAIGESQGRIKKIRIGQ